LVERDAGQVRATARASEQVVGRAFVEHLQLLQRFLTDHGLVQGHVVEHRAQRVGRVGILGCGLDRLRDRHAQAAGGVGELLAQGPSGLGQI